MTKYEQIDPILSQWAVVNGVRWCTEYQDIEVRTFYLNENRRDRVQVAVDAPQGEKTIIRIGQNRQGIWRLNRAENIKTTVAQLSGSLDKALDIARKWASQ